MTQVNSENTFFLREIGHLGRAINMDERAQLVMRGW